MRRVFSQLNPKSNKARALLMSSLVGSGLVMWLLFTQFGPGFALVLAPTIIVALYAYRIHIDRLEQKTKQISAASRIHLATVEALATAIDARDQVGAGHVRRTQIYAVGMGNLLGLTPDDIDALCTGALLHDIGKLAVPDHILNKQGELTPAEFEKTKIHAKVGASILEKVGFETPVVPTVKYHHERWDGKGYPDGLREENIPLTARILAVADTFDTLRGARPYRKAMTRDRARAVMQEESGVRFDPLLVDVLLRNLTALETEIDAAGLGYNEPNVSPANSGSYSYVEQIKLANREVFSLYELAREFSSSLNIQEAFTMFTEKVSELVPFDTCALYLLDPTKRWATAVQVKGENAALLEGRRMKIGQGATGFALKNRETVHNVDPDLDFSYSQVELTGIYRTMASTPLIANGELIGSVTIYSRQLSQYAEEHIRLLETVSNIAADALGKSLMHSEAQTNAMTDPMTALPNARSLQIQFDKEVARAKRGGTHFQLLMLDLDRFKLVNDSFGHKVGDRVLKEIGGVIRGQLRDYDFLARYAGDEFVALIPDTNEGDVIELCERIDRAVSDYALHIDGTTYASVGVSIGSAAFPAHGDTLDKTIIAADKQMYERKFSRKRSSREMLPPIEIRPTTLGDFDRVIHTNPLDDNFIVELDETAVVSASIN